MLDHFWTDVTTAITNIWCSELLTDIIYKHVNDVCQIYHVLFIITNWRFYSKLCLTCDSTNIEWVLSILAPHQGDILWRKLSCNIKVRF